MASQESQNMTFKNFNEYINLWRLALKQSMDRYLPDRASGIALSALCATESYLVGVTDDLANGKSYKQSIYEQLAILGASATADLGVSAAVTLYSGDPVAGVMAGTYASKLTGGECPKNCVNAPGLWFSRDSL